MSEEMNTDLPETTGDAGADTFLDRDGVLAAMGLGDEREQSVGESVSEDAVASLEAGAEPEQEAEPEPKPASADLDIKKLLAEIVAGKRDAEKQEEPLPKDKTKDDDDGLPPVAQLYSTLNPDDALLDQLTSENRADLRKGMQTLVQGIAQIIHHNVRQENAARLKALEGRMNQQTVQTYGALAYQQSVAADFYGTYPEFNQEALRPVVGKVAEGVMAKLGETRWNAKVRDETAQELRKLFGGAKGAAAPAASAQTPPKIRGGVGVKPAPPVANSEEDELYELLNHF